MQSVQLTSELKVQKSSSNLLNRANRNCTAMVQPKNNIAAGNDAAQLSHASTFAQEHSSEQSRNVIPDKRTESAGTLVNQYNSCHNNQTGPASTSSANYQTSTSNRRDINQQEALHSDMHLSKLQTNFKDGSANAHNIQRANINEPGRKTARHYQQIKTNKSELLSKSKGSKIGHPELVSLNSNLVHNNSQSSLKSFRSINKISKIGAHQNQASKAKKQNIGNEQFNPAISPANKSANFSKDQAFFQSQSFSSQLRVEATEHLHRQGLPTNLNKTGSCSGSSEKYKTQNISLAQNQQVPQQMIVNGFSQKPSNSIISSNSSASQAFQTKSRLNNTSNSSRTKMAAGSGASYQKHAPPDQVSSKIDAEKQSQVLVHGSQFSKIGFQVQAKGSENQLRSGNNSRKKQNQSTQSKSSQYTTDQKGKTVRHHESHQHYLHAEQGNITPGPQSIYSHSSSYGATLNSMRNLSGSLQKAPITASGSIYKSQRGNYYSKLSSKNQKHVGHEHSLHNAKTMKTLGVTATVTSESTGISRSGRSGDIDKGNHANQLSSNIHSSFSTSGIPRHPKLTHQKHSGTISNNNIGSGRLVLPNQKSQGSGCLTQNQTPNNLSNSNSQHTLTKQQQLYQSNKHQEHHQDKLQKHVPQSSNILNSSSHFDTSICLAGGSGSTSYQQEIAENVGIQYLPSTVGLHSSYDKVSSSHSHNYHMNPASSANQFDYQKLNPKIQRFDFRDYDSEEKLRIKPQPNQNNQNLNQQSSGINDKVQGKNNTLIKESKQVYNFDEAANHLLQLRQPQSKHKDHADQDKQQTNIANCNLQTSDLSNQDQSNNISYYQKKQDHNDQQYLSFQRESENKNPNIAYGSDEIQAYQKYFSHSKSTAKVNSSHSTTEGVLAANQASQLGDTVQIDDGKLKHYQQIIQNVKFTGLIEPKPSVQSVQIVRSHTKTLKNNNLSMHVDPNEQIQSSSIGTSKQQQFKSLQIEIPVENPDQDQNTGNHSVAKGDSQPNERSEGGQTSHSLLCGEENLLPSTEKKDVHSKISAQRIPKSGGVVGFMKTSTHLISNMQANRNIFLGKMPCNSTRNNSRHSNKIINEDFQLLFQKDKTFAARKQDSRTKEQQRQQNRDYSNDQNQETPKIMYKDRTSVSSRLLKDQLSFEKRISPESVAAKGKLKKQGSSKKKDQLCSNKKNQGARTSLMPRGTSQGPPITKNRENRITSEAANNTQQRIISEHAEDVKRVNSNDKLPSKSIPSTQRDNQVGGQSTLSKCIGIRSGSESNVKTNSSSVWNQAISNPNGPLSNMDKLQLNLQEQRGMGIQPAHKIIIPNDDPTKTSSKRTGIVRAYAANTNQGLVRNYNEDRVSIITNLLPPKSRTDIVPEKWPRCSYFGIYDGHGGSLCADFLRDNLHQYVIMESCFPANPKEAIIKGFQKAENAFMDKIYNPQTKELKDKSGSCAIVVLIVQEVCYVANVGDSRAVLSCEGGQKVYPLSLDHKPGEDSETKRIRAAGGQIYYRTTKNEVVQYDENKVDKIQQMTLAGPLRVLPGRLSVARTFGDPEAKIVELGGNPNVVIHTPEVKSFQIKKDHDFIVLGCDGIFDKMSNGDSVMCVWKAAHDNKYHQNVKGHAQDVHKLCGMGVEYILKNSLLRRSLDNVTVVVIGFSNLKHEVFGHQPQTLQFKSDNDSCPENQIKSQSQVLGSSQKLQHTKKQNIIANSHREREPQTQIKSQEKQDSGRAMERNRSANLPGESFARQGISMKYQQIGQLNMKSQDSMQKPSRKYSSTQHTSEFHRQQQDSDQGSNFRANYSSSGGHREQKDGSVDLQASESGPDQGLSIKKQYQNLHGNGSTGQLQKSQQAQTARPGHSSNQNQKDGTKPPLCSQNNGIKLTNASSKLGSHSATPTNEVPLKAFGQQAKADTGDSSNLTGIKYSRQSVPNQQLL